jgi:hypothetical protein
MTVLDQAALDQAEKMLSSPILMQYLKRMIPRQVTADELAVALDSLEPEDQTLLTLSYAEMLNGGEVARRMGSIRTPISTSQAVQKARMRLALLIEQPDQWTGLAWKARVKLRAQAAMGPDTLTLDRLMAAVTMGGWGRATTRVFNDWWVANQHQSLREAFPLDALRYHDRKPFVDILRAE